VWPEKLRNAGYTVECFATYFRDKRGRKEENVKDPRIIRFCLERQWVLVTTDRNMPYTHVETIKNSDTAIITTATNNDSLDVWINALIKLKPKIERCVKKHPRPWFAVIGKAGSFNATTITESWQTKRLRASEGQEGKHTR